MLKKDGGADGKGKLPHLFIPSKSATFVPEFTVEDLPLGTTVALVSEFAVKNLPSTVLSDDDDNSNNNNNNNNCYYYYCYYYYYYYLLL